MHKPTLSSSARALLSEAMSHPDQIAAPPTRLPAAAQRAVVQSLLKAGLLEEIKAGGDQPAWRAAENGQRFALRITAAGRAAVDPAAITAAAAGQPEQMTKAVSPRPTVRVAAQAVVDAWHDDLAQHYPVLADAISELRSIVATRGHVPSGSSRQPRPDTKRAMVLGLLRRTEGATVAQVAEATGWASHTVRGFFAGLKKAGTAVEVLERVRQVGPGKEGAKGSYIVYRVTEAG